MSYLAIPGGYETHASIARMDIDDLDMDQAMIELDKYMSRKLKQPFNISALTETLNATQNKLLIEHQNLEGLHNSVKHLASLEAWNDQEHYCNSESKTQQTIKSLLHDLKLIQL